MKLTRAAGQTCTFRVRCDRAHRASLVLDIFPGMPQIFPLRRARDGAWETMLHLAPGEYRFCYHLYDGRSLHYLTPAGLETDGLKAVLRVPGDGCELETAAPAAAGPAEPRRELAATHGGGGEPLTLRRVAG